MAKRKAGSQLMFASFMINDWIAGSLIAVTAGLVGFFVVLRGATFAAHALPLGTFPGAAAASLLGINPLAGLIAFAALGVFGITIFSRAARNDVATALTLIFLLGLGILLLSLSGHYANTVYSLLFGEILGVSDAEILPVAIIGLIVAAVLIASFKPLLLSTISPDLATASGTSPSFANMLFLGLLGLTTAMALPVVGALLVFSLMTGPPAAARAIAHRPAIAMALSAAIALVLVWAAIALSYLTNWPVGFFIGTLAALCYAASRVTVSSAAA
jgi:zinc/manganese transport system permease protein